MWILRALQVSHPDAWAHMKVPCSVCVCVRIHTHTPNTLSPTLKIEKTPTTPLSLHLSDESKINPHAKQQVPS